MHNSMKKEIKYFFSNYYWLVIIVGFTLIGLYFTNNNIELLKNFEPVAKRYLDFSNGGKFINIYNVMVGVYTDTSGIMILGIIFSFIMLSNSSVSYYIDERKGFINYQNLRVSKNKILVSKILVNTILSGIIFVIPHLILLVYYSCSYSYKLPIINDFDGCTNIGNCRVPLIDYIYSYQFPVLNIFINQILKPFLAGLVISLTVITFSLIAKKKSILMLFTNGFMFLLIAAFYVVQEKIFIHFSTKQDMLYELFMPPYLGLYGSPERQLFMPYLLSVIMTIVILVVLIFIFWRREKNEE